MQKIMLIKIALKAVLLFQLTFSSALLYSHHFQELAPHAHVNTEDNKEAAQISDTKQIISAYSSKPSNIATGQPLDPSVQESSRVVTVTRGAGMTSTHRQLLQVTHPHVSLEFHTKLRDVAHVTSLRNSQNIWKFVNCRILLEPVSDSLSIYTSPKC
eukprot:jgi/Botrbrau1/10931/Bobra.0025s0104.1